jgi:hypothetical protein
MEEKLLKAKELSELLLNLKKIHVYYATYIQVAPQDNGDVTLEVVQETEYSPKTLYNESFHNYADDPQKCTLLFLHNFFALPSTAEHISSPNN